VFGRTSRFPALFELRRLQPAQGGDGSEGVIFGGIDEFDRAGNAVSAAGDVNGDGIDDVLIAAYTADPRGRNDAGESYVVFGRRTGFPASFALRRLTPEAGGDGSEGFILTGAAVYDSAGRSISDAGDVNGDGVDDLLIGAPGFDVNGQDAAGATYVVFGRAPAAH
jgi:hypothetical protein